MRELRWWVAGAVLLLPILASAAPSTSVEDYAVLGLSSVVLGSGVQIDGGDVGANAKAGSVMLRARAHVELAVVADTIRFGVNATAGELMCTSFAQVQRSSASCPATPLALPLIDPLPTVLAEPGTEEIHISRFGSRTLPAGAYGVVRVDSGGQFSLSGGEYHFRSLSIGKRAALTCTGADAPTCLIKVKQRVLLGDRGTISSAAPLDARAIRIEIAGRGTLAAFRTYRKTTVDATVYAPNGRVFLGMSGHHTGAFIGDTVEVVARTRITGASAF